MGVFQTSSAGNAGQFVPGSFGPSMTGVVVLVVGGGGTVVVVGGTDRFVVVVVPAVVDVVATSFPGLRRGRTGRTEVGVGLLVARLEVVPDEPCVPEARGDAAETVHPVMTISAMTPMDAGACLIDRTASFIDCHDGCC